jgi:hypothetical protein
MKTCTEKFLYYNFLHPLLCSCQMHNVATQMPLVCSYSTVARPGPVLAAVPSCRTVLQNVWHSNNWLSQTFKRSQLDHILLEQNEIDYICCILSFGWFPGVWFYVPTFQNTVCLFHLHMRCTLVMMPRWDRQGVPQCQYIKIQTPGNHPKERI